MSVPATPIQLLDLAAQHAAIQPELDAALSKVMRAAAFIQGADVEQFAEELSRYLGGPHVIPCGNGTDALQLALMSLRLTPGAEVIVPAFTYVATIETVAILGLRPVVVDVRPDTFGLDPVAVAAALTPRTGAVIVAHLFGQCADVERLLQITHNQGIVLIEDNAQSLGATYTFADGRQMQAGTVGAVGTTSFFPSKNLGAFGDGGALFTRDPDRATYLRQLANHGQTRKYYHEHIGLNSRLDTLQAALLRVKLRYLATWTAARQRIAAHYDAALADVADLHTPARDPRSTHVFHQYTLTLENEQRRNQLRQHLLSQGVPSAIYYPLPVHLQPAYHYLNYKAGQFPVAEQLSRTVLSLPMHPMLTNDQVEYIVDVIRRF
ncbi:DegT/DnrJ/EryC1/StrS family aminotransferase [Hymenobacter sp. BT491]|uniref:DegT/DnrJ/EryC1/StrS family aminotransferase n=1 Tax=Hymenobacter sp. BT491 TaxID=2766779 RepID=UPI0021CC9687|nr:DegT/DnrJ/EryC1/StrS family aminotransferase [Hymenobacter sp. BT491]